MTTRSAPRPSARSAATLRAAVDAALQAYADRGVFRGFSARDAGRGSRVYRFVWLTRRPMVVSLAPGARRLTFVRVFPAVSRTPGLSAHLRRAVAALASRDVPAHRRLDPRRGTMTTRIAGGNLSLHLVIGHGGGAAAARAALGAVNDLFQLLHECYPDYLSAHFGVSDE